MSRADGTSASHEQSADQSAAISPTSVFEDEQLVIRCLRNEHEAWAALFEMCHPRIIARLRAKLGKTGAAVEMIQDIAAQVWVAILADEGRLLRKFDATAGARVSTYLNSIAVRIGLSQLREARRRLHREAKYAESFVNRNQIAHPPTVEIAEFAQSLSPKEAAFYSTQLIAKEETAAPEFTDQNSWQLRHRIRKKLLSFLQANA